MVVHAPTTPSARRSKAFPRSAYDGKGAPVRFTVADVLAMLDHGILPEDATTELLHGIIVLKDRSDWGDPPTVIGKKHRLVVTKLTALSGRINFEGEHVQIQNPVVCGEDEAPEPDFAVIRGPIEAYSDRLPVGADATCVVEVSDSSLERDEVEKGPIYASAGVGQYIILNLRDRSAIVHAAPDPAAGRFAEVVVVPEQGELTLRLAATTLTVPLRDLLPSPQ